MADVPPPDETFSPLGDEPTPNPGPSANPWALDALPEYQIIRELGRGGMGAVFLARNRLTGRLEALKVVAHTGAAERLLREIRAAAALSHPNVVTAYSARLLGGMLVFAMEYVDGEDLFHLVRNHGPLPVAEACEYIRQAALGLDHAHQRGMVHRDVKPHNLIRARDGTVKVLDFGLVRSASEEWIDQGLTPDQEAVGTPAYMAPELAADPRQADGRADIYGLGCTLYYLLTGGPPFEGITPYDVVLQHRDREPESLHQLRASVPTGLAQVVARMLAKDANRRYPTAAETAAALAPFAVPDVTPLPTAKGTGRRPSTLGAIAAGIGVIGLILLLAFGLNWFGTHRAGGPENTDTEKTSEPISLFNGQDLAGWLVDGGGPGEWWVEDGVIVTTALRNGPRSWLLTERELGNFILRFEYLLDRGANTGLAIRAVPGECPVLRPGGPPTPGPYHLQVELCDDESSKWAMTPTGQVHGGASRDGPVLKRVNPAQLKPIGQWNAVEVTMRGQGLRVLINGEEVQKADLTTLAAAGSLYPGLGRASGRVGFQQQTGTAKFRNVWLQELRPQANGS